jgi:hypothetical protein
MHAHAHTHCPSLMNTLAHASPLLRRRRRQRRRLHEGPGAGHRHGLHRVAALRLPPGGARPRRPPPARPRGGHGNPTARRDIGGGNRARQPSARCSVLCPFTPPLASPPPRPYNRPPRTTAPRPSPPGLCPTRPPTARPWTPRPSRTPSRPSTTSSSAPRCRCCSPSPTSTVRPGAVGASTRGCGRRGKWGRRRSLPPISHALLLASASSVYGGEPRVHSPPSDHSPISKVEYSPCLRGAGFKPVTSYPIPITAPLQPNAVYAVTLEIGK